MSRGALAYFSSANLYTMETIKSLSNMYNLPFLTWTNFARPLPILADNKTLNSSVNKNKREIFYKIISRFSRGIDDVSVEKK